MASIDRLPVAFGSTSAVVRLLAELNATLVETKPLHPPVILESSRGRG